MLYRLIKEKVASMYELEEYYSLDEAIKLYALIDMQADIEIGVHEDSMREMKNH